MNLKEAILFAQEKFKAAGITSAPLDAEVLLLETINSEHEQRTDKNWLYLNLDKYILSRNEEKKFKEYIRRREKQEPIAYMIGRKEFYGLDFIVNKNVLIPRPETEIIVDKSLEIIKDSKGNIVLLDIGTGSGCIMISILKSLNEENAGKIEKAYADDISEKALEIAKENAGMHKIKSKIDFLNCDLENALDKIAKHENVLVTANLPYISPADYAMLKPNVKRYEPRIALTTRDNGLYHIKRLIDKLSALEENFDSLHILLEADPKQIKYIESYAKKKIKGCKTEILEDIRKKKRTIILYR